MALGWLGSLYCVIQHWTFFVVLSAIVSVNGLLMLGMTPWLSRLLGQQESAVTVVTEHKRTA